MPNGLGHSLDETHSQSFPPPPLPPPIDILRAIRGKHARLPHLVGIRPALCDRNVESGSIGCCTLNGWLQEVVHICLRVGFVALALGKGVAGILQLVGVLDYLPPLALEPGPAAPLAVILCHARRGVVCCDPSAREIPRTLISQERMRAVGESHAAWTRV